MRDRAIRIETVAGGKPDPKQIETVFGELFGKLVVESSFVARLLRVLYVMLENLNENSRETLRVYLDNFPLPEQFTPFMPTLAFEDQEIELWGQIFPNAE